MKKDDSYEPLDIPLGLSMAMAQNPQAYDYFARLSVSQKKDLISSAHSAHSKDEMNTLVNALSDGETHSGSNWF